MIPFIVLVFDNAESNLKLNDTLRIVKKLMFP